MSETCKNTNEELLLSDNKTQPHESIIQESKNPSNFIESNHTQSRKAFSELNESSHNDNCSSRLSTPRVNYNKFSLHSSVDSRASTPSWAVGSNSNLQTGSEIQTLKQAKIIKSYGRNN